MQRRTFLKQTSLASILSFFNPLAMAGTAAVHNLNTLNFTSINSSSLDEVILPKGYIYKVILAWGDKLFPYSPKFYYNQNTSAAQLLQAGENHDGMEFFSLDCLSKAILAINHEYNNYEYLFAPESEEHYLKPWSLEKIRKAQASIGVSIIEINKDNNWSINLNSKYNTKYHVNSPMKFSGLARGNINLSNFYDKNGNKSLGTIANCSKGKTPWGTYLTCEENFDGYFTTDYENFIPNDLQKRYGISKKGFSTNWHKFDERFDINNHPNEANCFGWIVEINPYDKNFTPIKHTALGRFKHENIVMHINENQPLIAYMGDDEQGEYIYKYVSNDNYIKSNYLKNNKLLMSGKLYAAKFNDDNTGHWIELIFNEAMKNNINNKYIKSQADILIYTRYAADLVGATTMDRPEWLAISSNKTIYAALTNNKNRGVKYPINGVNPRKNNQFGQIIRWKDSKSDNSFKWNIFLLAGSKADGGSQDKILFNSPDSLVFDKFDNLWIATDGDISNKDKFAQNGNNQLLCANPKTLEIKRFMAGPKGCEISGMCFDDEFKTLFVNIQHPGEVDQYDLPIKDKQSKNDFIARQPLYISKWPHDKNALSPRSATIAIFKENGEKLL